jgi:hypothetical protein
MREVKQFFIPLYYSAMTTILLSPSWYTSIIAHQNESAILQQSSNSSPQFPTKTKLITEKIAETYQFFDFSFIKFIHE